MFPNEAFLYPSAIAQDIKGNIWITSQGQLTKYDGYSTTYYKSAGIGEAGFLVRVYADKSGIIWIGTLGSGLQRLDPSTNTFTQYKHDVKDSNSISNDSVIALLEDKEGNFWVGTNDGLNKLDRKTGKFTRYIHKANDPTSLSSDEVHVIYQDSKDVLWIGTGAPFPRKKTENNQAVISNGGGLNKLEGKTGKFTRFMHDDKDSTTLINDKVTAIFEDKAGNFWIGTAGDGLHLMNRQTGKFTRLNYDPKHPEKLSRSAVQNMVGVLDHITFITQDETGALWIGEFGRGLTRYDEQTKQVQHFNGKDSLSGFDGANENLFDACVSTDGLLWVTGFSGNIYTINSHTVRVPYIRDSRSHFSFYRSNASTLFLGTWTGLFSKNLKTGAIHEYPIKAPVYALRKAGDENLWIGTAGSGLYKLNLNNGSLLQFKHTDNDANSLSNNTVMAISTDKDQNTWVATERGLNKLANGSNKFVRYLHDEKDSASIVDGQVNTLAEDDHGGMWVGAENGVCKMNIATGKFRKYPLRTAAAIRKTSDGTIWIGGYNGLFRIVKGSDNIMPVIDSVNNQTFTMVLSIAEDLQKNVWFSTGKGLVKYDHRDKHMTIFNKNAGVIKDSLNWIAASADEYGWVYIGDLQGYYMFKAADLQPKGKAPEIVFTNFQIASQQIKPGDNAVLKQDILYTNSIPLEYNQNIFSVEFHPVDYNDPSENRCFYKLENYDNEWRPATNPAKAYYFNVPPGSYVFHVKAVNSLGIWAEKSIIVTVASPWWETWWFRVLSVIALVIVIYAIIKERSRKLKAENLKLEQKVTERTEELKKSLDELKSTQAQLIQSEKMASLGELTAGIAHEIQNPLNFVNNFSEVSRELIEELKVEKGKLKVEEEEQILDDIDANLEKINYHGRRADSIVKNMMQHSRTSSGQKELTDINALCDEYLRLSYHGLRAKDKSFNADFKTDFDETIGKINIVPQDIGRVLLNLYNNAFYAVNEKKKLMSASGGYQPIAEVKTRRINDRVEIKVSDNGNGIPQNIVDKIFQPFFTTKPTGQGTGLGLSLSYDIIKAHDGEIKVESKEGEGTEFKIYLPV